MIVLILRTSDQRSTSACAPPGVRGSRSEYAIEARIGSAGRG